MSNKSSGTGFECDFAEYMAEKGYWAHVFQNNRNGQPFDIILAKDGNTQAGDCKVCEKDIFRLERVEENQYSAMILWRQTGNGEGWFALRMTNGEVWFISLEAMERAMLTRRSLYWSEIKQFGITLEEWVSKCG